MSSYKERDAARDTNTPEREVAATWHQARDDARVRGDRTDDRPTRQNREDARKLEREVIDRGRDRPQDERTDRECSWRGFATARHSTSARPVS